MPVEVELRSFLTEEKYNQLKDFFDTNANFKGEDTQETHYFDCEQDLRIQKNNKGSKIWMKKGKIHDEDREEIEIPTEPEDFENLQKLFKHLNYGVEIKWFRKRLTYEWDKITVCLDHTKGYGHILELEILTEEKNKQQALATLKDKFELLKIPVTPRETFDKRFKYYKENWKKLTKS